MKRDKLKVLMKIDNFTYTVVLGKGSFGKVLLARIEGCDGVVAVKGMRLENFFNYKTIKAR